MIHIMMNLMPINANGDYHDDTTNDDNDIDHDNANDNGHNTNNTSNTTNTKDITNANDDNGRDDIHPVDDIDIASTINRSPRWSVQCLWWGDGRSIYVIARTSTNAERQVKQQVLFRSQVRETSQT